MGTSHHRLDAGARWQAIQAAALEVYGETPRPYLRIMLAGCPAFGKAAHARTGRVDLCQRRAHRRQCAPVQLVAVVERITRGHGLFRGPEGHDIVQGFASGGDFQQVDGAFAPGRGRFNPQAWAFAVPVDGVLVAGELMVGLHQAEAFGVGVGERVELQLGRVVQGPADPLAVAAPHGQAVRVVDLRVDGVAHAALMGAAAEHTGHGRDAQLLDGGARIDVRVDRHHHLVGLAVDIEAVGAGGAWRVEQGVDHKARGVLVRGFEPELREIGEFLAFFRVGINRQATRREAVLAGGIHRTEVAGAEKRQHVMAVQLRRLEQLEAGETQVPGQLLGVHRGFFIVEQ